MRVFGLVSERHPTAVASAIENGYPLSSLTSPPLSIMVETVKSRVPIYRE